ncbi:MAG: hypothetical protein K2J70_04655 [Muribaculaceae bacterium]|nr:hypothetical protein [Muribaculaceae bacterium]
MKTMNTKEKLSYGMASLSLICGFVLLFLSYYSPPEGEITSSVLYAFGEISIFSGSVMGISIQLIGKRQFSDMKGGTEKSRIDIGKATLKTDER